MPRKTTKRKTAPDMATVEDLSNVLVTPEQLRCLIAWVRLRDRNGYEPTVREVSKELGLADNGAISLLRRLDAKGIFLRKPVTKPGPRELTPVGKKWLGMGM